MLKPLPRWLASAAALVNKPYTAVNKHMLLSMSYDFCNIFTSLQADLTDPSSLPATLVGISAIIDCATARPEESTQKVDWEGKVALIQCAQVRLQLIRNSAGKRMTVPPSYNAALSSCAL